MYGIFPYIYHIFKPNVGKYAIHGSYGHCMSPLPGCVSEETLTTGMSGSLQRHRECLGAAGGVEREGQVQHGSCPTWNVEARYLVEVRSIQKGLGKQYNIFQCIYIYIFIIYIYIYISVYVY